VRAATPSNAAELVVPERTTLGREIDALVRRVQRAIEGRIAKDRIGFERLARKVGDPRHALAANKQRLDELDERLGRAYERRRKTARTTLDDLRERLHKRNPLMLLANDRRRIDGLDARLREVARRRLASARSDLAREAAKLDAMSPLRVLERGYALAIVEPDGRVVRSSSDVKTGDVVTVRLHEGRIKTRVEDVS
jgi:exodeoxyribonuclease VII large subunit